MIDNTIEFLRHAVARVPAPDDPHPGIAFFVDGNPAQHFCTCHPSGKKTCPHLKALYKAIGKHGSRGRSPDLANQFSASLWHELATVLSQGDRLTPQAVQTRFYQDNERVVVKVTAPDGNTVITYVSPNPDRDRLAERLGAFSTGDDNRVPDRAEILTRLQLLTMTDAERQLHDLNRQSRRQAFEGSLWFRLAYHCFVEFGDDHCRFFPAVDEDSGAFVVTCTDPDQTAIFHANIARRRVRPLLDCFRSRLPNQHDLPIHPIPLKSLFRVSRKTKTDLDVYPVIQMLQAQGEERFFSREGLQRFIYGDLVYIPELKILAELEKPDTPRHFQTPRSMTFKRYQIPSFLEAVGDDLNKAGFVVDPDVKGLKLLRKWHRMVLTPTTIDRDWCWISVAYGFGDASITLTDLLKARKESTRYIGTPGGWVDTQAETVAAAAAMAADFPPERFSKDGQAIRLSRQELFQLSSLTAAAPTVAGTAACSQELVRILELTPAAAPPEPGLTAPLRHYQQVGLNWLWWLWENRLGGLLCDDMGLGKTHQIMALMACIHQVSRQRKPCLVVCPTTVLSHWMMKLKQHAPALAAEAYHGGDRNLTASIEGADVLITSYGLMLRDIDALRTTRFALVVLDEIQNIKNADTKTHAAARALDADIKIGLTGTPIENSILELKALMDIAVPGYLGTDQHFSNHFVADSGAENKERLRRLIYPFTLRRLKSRVLQELPEKIEDIRLCELTEKQIKLYRDAIERQAAGIVSTLQDETASIPYIHIFALLTLLKQICNHPATINRHTADDSNADSGKWELFKELLDESLASGQKVVVYSQFTAMIEIIADHLGRQGIGHVVLTGRSRDRGRLIETFNSDPACRVFVGSLKAGGTGIDLVAGSVVIHYDRWWNAAKEDQATDRVHRIGQRRGVQVFKLVTAGTLEEKISAIIEKKRRLMADIVREDDPGLLKAFNRQELLALIS
jgi:superfamily II DNA or RNA helicase